MKTKFTQYAVPTDEEFKQLWDTAAIAFDANVLLNLYSYSEAVRNDLLELVGQFSDRIWLPYQAAKEYYRNRLNPIYENSAKYDGVKKAIDEAKAALAQGEQHPALDEKLRTEFSEIVQKVLAALEDEKNRVKNLSNSDPIRDRLETLFDGRVGDEFSADQLEKIYSEGKSRYAKGVPPGFGDDKKPEPDKFGDLVIWKELIEYACARKCPIVLVTNDRKGDWWWIGPNSNTLGPRPELRAEFAAKTNQKCYLYSFDSFVDYAKQQGKKVAETTIDEVKKTAQEQRERTDRWSGLSRHTLAQLLGDKTLTSNLSDYFLDKGKALSIPKETLEALSRTRPDLRFSDDELKGISGYFASAAQLDDKTLNLLKGLSQAKLDDSIFGTAKVSLATPEQAALIREIQDKQDRLASLETKAKIERGLESKHP